MSIINNVVVSYDGDESWLSNFSPVSIQHEDNIYASVEHAYMSAKSNDLEWKHYCADWSNSAAKVKKASKLVNLIDDWDSIKLTIMNELLFQKFSQEPFKTLLLNTGNMILREGNTWNDKFWGCTLDGEGLNHLGNLQMKIRTALRSEPLF